MNYRNRCAQILIGTCLALGALQPKSVAQEASHNVASVLDQSEKLDGQMLTISGYFVDGAGWFLCDTVFDTDTPPQSAKCLRLAIYYPVGGDTVEKVTLLGMDGMRVTVSGLYQHKHCRDHPLCFSWTDKNDVEAGLLDHLIKITAIEKARNAEQ